MHPYHIHIFQAFNESDEVTTVEFCEKLVDKVENDDSFLVEYTWIHVQYILLTDELRPNIPICIEGATLGITTFGADQIYGFMVSKDN